MEVFDIAEDEPKAPPQARGRKPKNQSHICVYLPEGDIERVRLAASAYGASMSDFARQAVRKLADHVLGRG